MRRHKCLFFPHRKSQSNHSEHLKKTKRPSLAELVIEQENQLYIYDSENKEHSKVQHHTRSPQQKKIVIEIGQNGHGISFLENSTAQMYYLPEGWSITGHYYAKLLEQLKKINIDNHQRKWFQLFIAWQCIATHVQFCDCLIQSWF